MGQQQATTAKPKLLSHNTEYQIDPRLVEFKNTLPSYFSATAEKTVQQITTMMNQIPQQPLEEYLTNAIDNRFIHHPFQSVKKLQQQFQVQNEQWYDLSTQERFLNVLKFFTKQYQIEKLIHIQYKRLEAKSVNEGTPAYQSLRNRMEGAPVIVMNEELIIRMLLGYYLKQIKIYANSGQKHISRFHQKTGRQLCLIIIKGYLSLMQLYTLFYQFVYIDKHPNSVQKKLSIINQSYHSQCLKTQYSINIDKKKLDKYQMAARLYLDQLYLNSMREAEDPEIKNSDDTLLPIKMFPISRVKDKPRT